MPTVSPINMINPSSLITPCSSRVGQRKNVAAAATRAMVMYSGSPAVAAVMESGDDNAP